MLNAVVKQIKVKDETYDELRKLGSMGESFDEVIRRVISHYKKTVKK